MSSIITPYQAKRASDLANPTAATVFKQADNALYGAFVRLMPTQEGSQLKAFRGRLFARGRATTGTTSNFLAKIQFNSDVSTPGQWTSIATAGNNTDFFTLTNRSYATITRYWEIAASICWDSTSLRLTGQGNGLNAETIETASAAITALTAIDLSTGKCGFVIAAIFGTSNASNVATLDEFVVEAV